MADSLNKYSNEAAYSAASHGNKVPEVSKVVGSENPVRFDGRNTDTTGSPSVGDAVYLDPDDNVRFISWKNLVPSALGTGWYPIGVVINRFGRKVRLRYKDTKTIPTVYPMIYRISNQTSNSITFTVPDTLSGTTTVALGVTFTASTSLSSNPTGFIAELDTWLRANQPGKNNLPGIVYNWHAEYINSEPLIICDSANRKNGINITATGMTITLLDYYTAPITKYPELPIKGGYQIAHGLINNIEFCLAYNGTRTPTSNVGLSANGSPVTKDAFLNSEYCATLRANYDTYDDYLYNRLIDCPTKKHAYFTEWNGNSLELSRIMATYTYPDINGVVQPYFYSIVYTMAPDNSSKSSIINNAFDWHMPDVIEAHYYTCDRGTDLTDPVWSTMSKISSTQTTINQLSRDIALNSWKYNNTQWKLCGIWSYAYDGGDHERHRSFTQMAIADYDLTGRT